MRRIVLALFALGLIPSCNITEQWVQWTGGNTAPLDELEPPGYFDIGMGFGFFSDDPLDDTQSTGVLLSVKAYPTGRWFGKRKAASDNAWVQATKKVAARNRLAQQVPDAKALQSEAAAAYAHGVLKSDETPLRNAFGNSRSAALQAIGKALRAYQTPEGRAKRHESVHGPVVEALDGFDQDAVAVWIYEYGVTSGIDVAASWKQSTAHLAATPAKDLYQLIAAEAEKEVTLTPSQAMALTPEFQMLSEAESRDWVVADERDQWFHRLSIFYGYTLDELEGSVQDHLHVVGVGYDVAPQFSILAGFGFHSDDGMGMTPGDASSGLFLGTSLNLSTFKSGFKALVGGE